VPDQITNVLLLGSDGPADAEISRTDTMIIVSINRREGTASMVSLPRDLYVYIPGWTMGRLNTALPHGSASGYPTGAVGQLKDTILYNFGIPVHYYARVDFDGFKTIIDQLGGVEIAVSCRFEDWRLKSPELDPEDEESWALFALEPGIHEMDGDMALWYARSRLRSSDFDRGRRQQQLLRAMLVKGLDTDLLPQVPALYDAYRETVETDMDIGRILQLAALAPTVDENGIQNLYLVGNQLQPWVVPGSGAQVQLPRWENMQYTFQYMLAGPALNGALRSPITVEVINASGNPEMGRVAVENLAWYGFVPTLVSADNPVAETSVTYYGENVKGAFDWLLSWVMNVRQGSIELDPDTDSDFDYQVVLGADYNSCINELFAPRAIIP
jgi:LCP family protein required for cell wall assembly